MTGLCANCGEVLGDDGLCAYCLMAGGLETETAAATVVSQESGEGEDWLQDSFGPYSIVKAIGEGGMGTVYLAEQRTPIQRRVALKVVKLGMDTRAILQRFRYERQALAMMDHPNIARVYDASETAKGRPYFVMEYIVGEPITSYCDRRRMTTKDRLRLFIPVCHALQHAHSKGILHRDIKPSNVLVTEVDGAPVPKVIDFGIAKALDHRRVEQSLFTQFGQFVGTPEYMSPEAADVVKGDVDTTSDVYSLGVLLYELLVGAVPFDGKQLREAGLAELLRIIREVDAPPLPAKLTQLGKTLSEIAERRNTSPLTLRKEVAGELNLIALKAVEKQRQRRYGSVQMLWEDIQRFLDDHPVHASPPSRVYRMRKFVRRHRAMVAGGVAVAAAVLAGTIATAWQANEARRERAVAVLERDIAGKERTEAERQRARAEASAQRAQEQFKRAETNLQDVRDLAHLMLFELDEQLRDLGGTMAARRTLLQLGLRYLEKADAGDPNLGKAYFRVAELQGRDGLRDLEKARVNYERSSALLEARIQAGSADEEERRFLALAIWRLGQMERSELAREPRLRRAEAILRGMLGNDGKERETMAALARVSMARELPEEAVRWAERAAAGGNARASHLAVLAEAQIAMAKWIVVRPNARDVLVWMRKAVDSLDHAAKVEPGNVAVRLKLADALLQQADYCRRGGQMETAVAAVNRAVALAKAAAAMDTENAAAQALLARCHVGLSANQLQGGTLKELRAAGEEAVQVYRKQVEKYPDVPQHRLDLAEFLLMLHEPELNARNYKAALAAAERAQAVLEETVRRFPGSGEARRLLSRTLAVAGRAHAGLRDAAKAAAAFERSIAEAGRARAGAAVIFEDRAFAAEMEYWAGYSFGSLGMQAERIRHLEMAAAWYRSRKAQATAKDAGLEQWGFVQKELALGYLRQGDVGNAKRVLGELRPLIEARYREGYESIADALWDNLFAERIVYRSTYESKKLAAVAERSMQVFEGWWRAWPEDSPRRWNYLATILNSRSDMEMSGNRDAALRMAEREQEVHLEFLNDKSTHLFSKLDMFRTAVTLVGQLRSLGVPERGIAFGNKILPWLEHLVDSDPENRAAFEHLLVLRTGLRFAYADTGKLAEALEEQERVKELRASRAARPTGADIHQQARDAIVRIHLKERLGRAAEAREELGQAIASMRALMEREERAWEGAGGKDATLGEALDRYSVTQALLLERAGDLDGALVALQKAIQRNRLGAGAESARELALRRRALRLLSMQGASPGTLREWAPAGAATQEQLREHLGHAWIMIGVDLSPSAYRPEECARIFQKSVEYFESVPGGPVDRTSKGAHASAWYWVALSYRQLAVESKTGGVAELEKAQKAIRESRRLWQAMKDSGTLPPQDHRFLMEAVISDQAVTSRLEQARARLAAQRK